MAMLASNYFSKSSATTHQGLTLIEVLMALAVISIALTAVIKATAQNIRSTHYLENKTLALWVGEEIIKEAQLKLLVLPTPPEVKQDSMRMLNKTWFWQAHQEVTDNKHINRLQVQVFAEEHDPAPMLTLESYVLLS